MASCRQQTGDAMRSVWYGFGMPVIRAFLLALLLSMPAVGTAAPGDEEFDLGYTAFAARKYDEALKWWQLAAEKNHLRAQNGLGVLYRDGDVGEPDKARAAHWFGLSAENGYAFAMYSLAMLYRDGEGVERDDIEAHKWFNLAATLNFDPKSVFQRDLIARRMKAEDVAEAQRRAQEWINTFFFGRSST